MSNQMDAIYNHFLTYVETILGSGGTFSDDLHQLGTKLFKTKFCGVFPKDMIPQTNNFQYAIMNLDDHDEPGSHWVALCRIGKSRSTGYLVYDSFGRPTSEIMPGMPFPTQDTDSDAEQLVSEDNCGARALAWLLIADIFGPEAARLI